MYKQGRLIRAVLDLPRTYDPCREVEWHESAIDVFVHGEPAASVDEMAAFGAHILTNMPYRDIRKSVERAASPAHKLAAMRFHRKLLMIGRDTLNLCNANDLIDFPSAYPLRQLTSSLGKVADTGGSKRIHVKEATKRTRSAGRAVHGIDETFIAPVSTGKLAQRCELALGTELLLDPESINLHPHAYHGARRSFRTVTHLGIVSYLVAPSLEKLDYVQLGVELNRMYGERHQGICEQSMIHPAADTL